MRYEAWMHEGWFIYKAAADPTDSGSVGEVDCFREKYVSSVILDEFVVYRFRDELDVYCDIAGSTKDAVILPITHLETQHAYSNLITFLKFYRSIKEKLPVLIDGTVLLKYPVILEILQVYVAEIEILIISPGSIVFVEQGYVCQGKFGDKNNDPIDFSFSENSRFDAQSLDSSSNIAFEQWKQRGIWNVYKFNYLDQGFPTPKEVNHLDYVFLRVEVIQHYILYISSDGESDVEMHNLRVLPECIMLLVSTINAGHALSEVLSFYNFFKGQALDIPIAIPLIIKEKLPYIFLIIESLFAGERILIIDDNTYFCGRVWLRRNTHLNFVRNWYEMQFFETEGGFSFSENAFGEAEFEDDPSPLLQLAHEAGASSRSRLRAVEQDYVMFVKLRTDGNAITPQRGMIISDEAHRILSRFGISILKLENLDDLDHYIGTIHNAKVFITSYGSTACTNRFFCNAQSHVLLLANMSYASEYGSVSHYELGKGDDVQKCFSFTRATHLFRSTSQTVFLDFPDEIGPREAQRIVDHLGSRGFRSRSTIV
ncbi:hypothetical protein C8J38_1321 [Rhizobium sp. PP-WC-2G-219]|nr:hypothetical protein C8J38_1321 [Rhizobium sp. PP-WC-2G-219]